MFIAFEGLDGSGKTTVSQNIRLMLQDSGLRCNLGYQPTKSGSGKLFRNLASRGHPLSNANEILIQDRAVDVFQNILPAIRSSEVYLTDRYYYSHVFQSSGLSEYQRALALNMQRFPRPDLCLFLKTSISTSKQRIRSRGRPQLLERRLGKASAMYKSIFRFPEVRLVDAEQDLSAVTTDCLAHIKQAFSMKGFQNG